MKEMTTSRQRLIAAMKHEETDILPVSPRIHAFIESYYGCHCWIHQLKAGKEFGFDPCIFIGPLLPNYIANPFSKDDYKGLKSSSVRIDIQRDGRFTIVRREFQTPSGRLTDLMKLPKPGGEFGVFPHPYRIERLFKGRDDLDSIQYLLPDPEMAETADYQEIEMLVGESGLVEVQVYGPLDGKLGDIMSFEDLMMLYYDDRELLKKMLRIFHDHVLGETRVYLEAGVKIIFAQWFYESLSSGWSPAMYRELFIPLIKEHVMLVHSYDGIYHFYDDGKCMDIIDDLKEAGIDVLSTLTPPPMGDFDLKEAKRRIGDKVCLKGYVDLLNVMKLGTPDQVREIVRGVIDIAYPGGGFILGTSDSLREGTPLENLRAYVGEARKYGSKIR